MLLIDTRDEPAEPEREHDWSWVGAGLSLLFPWPAIIVWLFVGTVVLHDAVGMLFGVATIAVVAWRGAKAYPKWGGLSDHHQ
jgi:hypothetical protein